MIVTITLNPAVDQTIFLSGLELGEVNRYQESQLDPAGKGINVSRLAHRLGWPTIAFGFLAGEIGAIIEQALTSEGVQHQFVKVGGQTRLNTTLVDRTGKTSTGLYGPGPTINEKECAALDELVDFWMHGASVAVFAGSLPPGVPQDTYAGYIRLCRARGVKTILDADGEAFALGLAAGPTLVKPNRKEAEQVLGYPLRDLVSVVRGARELTSRGTESAVISMGASGAVAVSGDRVWLAKPPSIDLRSTVGSGDSMVAGLAMALAKGLPISEGLRFGTAAGAATAKVAGTALGTRADVEALLAEVKVEMLDP